MNTGKCNSLGAIIIIYHIIHFFHMWKYVNIYTQYDFFTFRFGIMVFPLLDYLDKHS